MERYHPIVTQVALVYIIGLQKQVKKHAYRESTHRDGGLTRFIGMESYIHLSNCQIKLIKAENSKGRTNGPEEGRNKCTNG